MAKRNMVQAIRAYCLQCANHSKKEVELCTVKKCPLYQFRLGTDQPVPHHQDKDRAEVESSVQPSLFD